jgi:hypothetical protein
MEVQAWSILGWETIWKDMVQQAFKNTLHKAFINHGSLITLSHILQSANKKRLFAEHVSYLKCLWGKYIFLKMTHLWWDYA